MNNNNKENDDYEVKVKFWIISYRLNDKDYAERYETFAKAEARQQDLFRKNFNATLHASL